LKQLILQLELMKKGKNTSLNTRERILEAAGGVFAEYGFRYATVRDICTQAGVNVAAVNYYFRDKENLYTSVLKYWRGEAFKKYPLDIKIDDNRPAEEHLATFIRYFLLRVLEEGQPSWFWKLVAKEYIEPTSALDMLVEETIRPTFQFLSSVVRRLVTGPVSEETVRLCCLSIVSQCLFFVYGKHVIKKLFQKDDFKTEEIETIAAHITRFSLQAINNQGSGKDGRGDQS
jgi:AcrR family transcriptional regulator